MHTIFEVEFLGVGCVLRLFVALEILTCLHSRIFVRSGALGLLELLVYISDIVDVEISLFSEYCNFLLILWKIVHCYLLIFRLHLQKCLSFRREWIGLNEELLDPYLVWNAFLLLILLKLWYFEINVFCSNSIKDIPLKSIED